MLALLLIARLTAADSCPIVREFPAPSPDGHVLAAEVITRGGGKRPTVVLISGSGPQTRDYSTDLGNDSSGNGAFAFITAALLDAGYAVIRFDERGTGKSTGDYAATATTATLADDVERVLAAARRLPEVDAKRFVLLGHSEGTIIALLVASRGGPVGALVLLAAPAWTGERVMAYQQAWLAGRVDRARREARVAELAQEHAQRIATDPWYRFFLTFDPLPVARKVRAPALLLYGERDWRVTLEQAPELAAAMREAGNRRVTVDTLINQSHAFTMVFPEGGVIGPFSEVTRDVIMGWLGRELPGDRMKPRCADRRLSR